MEVFNLQIPDSQLKTLLTYYEDRKRDIVKNYKTEVEAVDLIIKQIKKRLTDKEATNTMNFYQAVERVIDRLSGEFNETWTWKQKIVYVLNEKRETMTCAAILKILDAIDPVTRKDPKTANRSVSGTLSHKSTQGDTFYVDKTGKENLYGLLAWQNGKEQEGTVTNETSGVVAGRS